MIEEKDGIKIIKMGHGTIGLKMKLKNGIAEVSFGQIDKPMPPGNSIEKQNESRRQVAIEFKDSAALDRFINDLVALQESNIGSTMFHKKSYNLGLRDSICNLTSLIKT